MALAAGFRRGQATANERLTQPQGFLMESEINIQAVLAVSAAAAATGAILGGRIAKRWKYPVLGVLIGAVCFLGLFLYAYFNFSLTG